MRQELYTVSWTQAYDTWTKNELLSGAEEIVEIGLQFSDFAEAREVLVRIMSL
jgi:hypothetical protein